jgi:hypothetical protein
MKKNTYKALQISSLGLLLISGQAISHTGVRDTAESAKASYNGFTITHGCAGDNGTSYPVIGQSALFPFGDNTVWKSSTGTVLGRGKAGHTGISTAGKDHSGNALPDIGLNLAVVGYVGGSPFASTYEIFDTLGNVQALLWKDGAMPNNMNAITPFKVTPPTITDKCISALKVRIGVINYCDTGKNATNDKAGPYAAPKDAFGRLVQNGTAPNSPFFSALPSGNGDNNRADWWFTAPDGSSSLYNDISQLQATFWTTMTVNNPNAAVTGSSAAKACPGGKTRTVSVEPTGKAFDTYLNATNLRGFSIGSSNF